MLKEGYVVKYNFNKIGGSQDTYLEVCIRVDLTPAQLSKFLEIPLLYIKDEPSSCDLTCPTCGGSLS
jgi:hypothetical protein